MSRAVQFDQYGGVDVLEVRDVPRPSPADGEVLVRVKTAGLNPAESVIRQGYLRDQFPLTFPSGQGSDFAGVVTELGRGVTGFAVDDEVIGFSQQRSSHAEYVTVPAAQLIAKPAEVSWDAAGALYGAGSAAYAAIESIALTGADTVAIAGAAGGVGSIAVQLAARAGATVLGIAGPTNDTWLREHGAIPVNYGPDLAARLSAASPSGRVDAFLDFFGDGYVALAVDELGVAPARVNTVIDFAAAEKYSVHAVGSAEASSATVLAELADLVARGELEIPVAQTYPLDAVREAYRDLERRHTRGKIVLHL